MGFYIRKSISVGPLRFNLSKSGIGVSAGIPGFRVGTGPRGNYVHAGKGGVYYRQSLPNRSQLAPAKYPSRTPSIQPYSQGVGAAVEIESAQISKLIDSSSRELVNEINEKIRMTPYWPFVLIGGGSVCVLTQYIGVPALAVAALAIVSATATIYAGLRDIMRKTTVLFYTFEQETELRFQALHDSFDSLSKCSKSWNIQTRAAVYDQKRNAGASEVIERSQIRLRKGHPKWMKTNIPVPVLPAGRQTLYFFPDRILVFESDSVGAVSYSNLTITISQKRFIEDTSIPYDSQIVDRTWKFVNKSGGPDRRFNNNTELPIVEYESILLRSSTGLNELFYFSKTGIGESFRRALLGQNKY